MTTQDHDKSERLFQGFTNRWFILLFGVPLTYSIFRYHIVGVVDWEHFPLFIANKAISMSSVFFIATSYLIGKTIKLYEDDFPKRLILIKFCGLMGFSMASMHAFMAMLLFTPDYYAKFFHESGQMNLTGELSMLFGVLSLWCLTITAITSLPFMYDAVGADRWHRGQRMGYFSLLLVAGHLIVMGLHGWLAPSGWPAYLPPISLVACIAAMIPLLVKMTGPSKKKE